MFAQLIVNGLYRAAIETGSTAARSSLKFDCRVEYGVVSCD